MATSTAGKTREQRAEAREQRRKTAAAKPQASRRQATPQKQAAPAKRSTEKNGPAEPKSSGGSPGTGMLLVAGAAAGALVGTARLLRKRHGEASNPSAGEGETDESVENDSTEARGGRGQQEQSGGLRSLLANVLNETADALSQSGRSQEPASAGTDDDDEGFDDDGDTPDDDDEEDEDEDEDDEEDDEDDRRLRGEDEGRPEPRGESDDAGPVDGDEGERDGDDDGDGPAPASSNGPASGADALEVVRRAREQLAELVGRAPESVSRVEATGEGWHVALEVVELERIPHSTDVLASYEVSLDGDGRLVDYARGRRYVRNRADEVS